MERAFGMEDQVAFAELSGDHNPVHLDEVQARRSQFGRPIVHGVHMVMWALDRWLAGSHRPVALVRLTADFRAAIGVNEPVVLRLPPAEGEEVNLHVTHAATGAELVHVEVRLQSPSPAARRDLPRVPPETAACRLRTLEELSSAAGELELYVDSEQSHRLFPNLATHLSDLQLASVLATTRLVGMECPGRYSLFSKLDLSFHAPEAAVEKDTLRYRVTRCDPRFSLVQIAVSAPGCTGMLKTFLRSPPRAQPSFSNALAAVSPSEFAKQHALVIGGSRGLGELVTKLLAAGGAKVTATYLRGSEDARRVAEEVVEGGGAVEYLRLDVTRPELDAECRAKVSGVTHLYYLATPAIQVSSRGTFSAPIFEGFCDHYVHGFARTLEVLRSAGADLRHIFYPSSTAIDELPLNMGEYAAAKVAGEVLCRFLQKTAPSLRILAPRLPRLPSDQTGSLLYVEMADPTALLLGHLRALAAS